MKLDLAEIKKRLQPRSALALTLESDRIAIGVVRRENGESKVVAAPPVPVGSDQVFRDPDKAAAELSVTLEAAGIRERRCVVCVPPDIDIEEASAVMRDRHIRHLPVCDSDGLMLGLVSIGDLNAMFANSQQAQIASLHEYIYGRV